MRAGQPCMCGREGWSKTSVIAGCDLLFSCPSGRGAALQTREVGCHCVLLRLLWPHLLGGRSCGSLELRVSAQPVVLQSSSWLKSGCTVVFQPSRGGLPRCYPHSVMFLEYLAGETRRLGGEQGVGRVDCSSKLLNTRCAKCSPSGDLYHHPSPNYSAVLTAIMVIVVNGTDNTLCCLFHFLLGSVLSIPGAAPSLPSLYCCVA